MTKALTRRRFRAAWSVSFLFARNKVDVIRVEAQLHVYAYQFLIRTKIKKKV